MQHSAAQRHKQNCGRGETLRFFSRCIQQTDQQAEQGTDSYAQKDAGPRPSAVKGRKQVVDFGNIGGRGFPETGQPENKSGYDRAHRTEQISGEHNRNIGKRDGKRPDMQIA